MEKSYDQAHSLLPLPTKFSDPLSKFLNRNNGKGKNGESNDGELPILVKDDSDQTQDGKNIFEKTRDGIGDRSLNEVDIIGDPGNDDAGGRFGKEGEGKGLEMIIEFLPDIEDDPQPHKIHQVGLAIKENTFREREKDDCNGEQEEPFHILFEEQISKMKLYDHISNEGWNSFPLEKDTVEGRFNKECLAGRQQGIKDHADHSEAQL
jgi:hypothetical protein